MNGKALLERFKKSGTFDVSVRDDSVMLDSYAQKGMIGRVVDIRYEHRSEDDPCGDVMAVKIDWKAHEAHNLPLESKNWYVYDKSGNGRRRMGTMKEAGFYPEDGIELNFVMEKSDSGLDPV